MMNSPLSPAPAGLPTATEASRWERGRGSVTRRWARRHGLRAAIAVALIAAGASTGAALAARGESDTVVLVTARAVDAGQRLTAADLRSARLGTAAGVPTIPAGRRAQLVGRRVGVPLAAGQLLSAGVLAGPAWPAAGQAVVAVNLAAGQYPPSIAPGSPVEAVLAAGPNTDSASVSSSGTPATVTGQVISVTPAATGDGSAVVELRLPTAGAQQVTAAAAVTLVAVSGD